jgi:protease I
MRVACLIDSGFEDEEFRRPVAALRDTGHNVDLVGLSAGRRLKGRNGLTAARCDRSVEMCRTDQYDAVLIPGGYSPEHLREHADVVAFVRDMARLRRYIFAISRGPQLLLSAEMVRGRHMTAFPTIQGDLRQAGALVSDEEVVVDGNLITSRRVEDLPAFVDAILAVARHRVPMRHAV